MRSKTPEALRRTPKPDALRIPVTGKIDGFVAVCTDGSQKFFTKSEMAQFPPRTTEALASGLESFKGPMGDIAESYRKSLLEEMTTRLDEQDPYKITELRNLRKKRNILAATSLPAFNPEVRIEITDLDLQHPANAEVIQSLSSDIKVGILDSASPVDLVAKTKTSRSQKARAALVNTAVAVATVSKFS